MVATCSNFALNGCWSSETRPCIAISMHPFSPHPQYTLSGGEVSNTTYTTSGWPPPLRECEGIERVQTSRWIGAPQVARFERDGWLPASAELAIYDRPIGCCACNGRPLCTCRVSLGWWTPSPRGSIRILVGNGRLDGSRIVRAAAKRPASLCADWAPPPGRFQSAST
jgi:hypothetical protein